jgi:hypothetical protein
MVVMHVGVPIVLAGTEAPAALAEAVSVGGLGKSVHANLSECVCLRSRRSCVLHKTQLLHV